MLMRKRKKIFASLDLRAEKLNLVIMKKTLTGIKTLLSENFSRNDLTLVSHKLQEYRPKEVILLTSQEKVIVRDFTLPRVDEARIKSMLYYELAGILPYSMEQIQLDYILLHKSRKEIKVKSFVIPDYLFRDAELLKDAGIYVTRIIPRGLALTGYYSYAKSGVFNRLINVSSPNGQLVVYPDIQKYFCKSYNLGQSIDISNIKKDCVEQGIEPESWDLVKVGQSNFELIGAIYFYLKNPRFNLYRTLESKNTQGFLKVGIVLTIIAILAINMGIFYIRYKSAHGELDIYQERLERLMPRILNVNKLKTDFTKDKNNYEKLVQVSAQDTDYLIWLKELHLLLQEDTDVNVLIFDGGMLRELHGKAPSATKVTGRLQDSPYFSSPEFISPITPRIENGKEIEEFSIKAVLTNPFEKGGGVNE